LNQTIHFLVVELANRRRVEQRLALLAGRHPAALRRAAASVIFVVEATFAPFGGETATHLFASPYVEHLLFGWSTE
jgi:hypothetical protein